MAPRSIIALSALMATVASPLAQAHGEGLPYVLGPALVVGAVGIALARYRSARALDGLTVALILFAVALGVVGAIVMAIDEGTRGILPGAIIGLTFGVVFGVIPAMAIFFCIRGVARRVRNSTNERKDVSNDAA